MLDCLVGTCIFSMAEVLLPVSELSRDTECTTYDSFPSFPRSHPSDLKHRFHRHQSSGSLHGSFNHNHVQDTSEPLVAEEHDEEHDKGPVYDPKQDVFSSLFVSFTLWLKVDQHMVYELVLTRLPKNNQIQLYKEGVDQK